MLRVTVKGLLAHKRRLLSTFLAVFLGIAFLTGTLVLGATIKRSFNNLLATVNSGVDVLVRRTEVGSTGGGEGFGGRQRGRLDAGVVDTVRGVPGVAAAEGDVQTGGVQLLDKSGQPLLGGGRGAPALGGSWRTDPALNPFRLVAGRPPAAPDDVVIDRASANKGHFQVGDSITILTPDSHIFRVSGIATFGNQDSRGGGSDVQFTLSTAQSLLGAPGKIDEVVVRAVPGVSQDVLVARVRGVVPSGAEAITGASAVKDLQDAFQQRVSGFTTFLSSFAFVAVIVGAFVIYNTFSILVAQRTREMALLRAVGASRSQVLGSVVTESVVVGFVASGLGVAGGIAVGAALRGLFRAGGFPFPPGGLVLTKGAVMTGLIIGLLVTVGAALAPALRASRVAPLAALREAAIDTSNTSRVRSVIGFIVTALGLVLIVAGVAAKNAPPIGFGAALTLIGALLLGPFVAVPVARLIGAPATRVRGVTGAMARENAMRNPRRTAGTAAALLVGVAVVTFFTVIAASLQATTSDQIDKSFVGDVAVGTGGGFRRGGLSPQLTRDISRLPAVAAAAPLRIASVTIAGADENVLATDPAALARVVKVDLRSGAMENVGARTLAVSRTRADSLHLSVGSPVSIQYADREPQSLTVAAIFDSTDVLDTPFILSTTTDDANNAHPVDQQVFVKFRPGVDFSRGRAAVEQAAKPYPTARVEDQHDLKQRYISRINSFLAIIFGMLALAIVIALMGISNTLQLSVYERTRELGLLRAVGTTRSQVRAMVRWEAMIIALFGTIGGVILGVTFGWAIVHGLGRDSQILFAVPYSRAVLIVVIGAAAGILAALRPAMRAGRLNVLEAIAAE